MMGKFNFIHIPKCGGTTLARIFKNIYGDKFIQAGSEKEKNSGWKSADVLMGHYNWKFYNHLPLVTFLRHPVERVISHWNYKIIRSRASTYPSTQKIFSKKHKFELLEFAEMTPNIMCSYIEDGWESFIYIGFTENYDKSLHSMGKIFNFQPPLKYKKYRVSSLKREKIYTTEEYQTILELNEKDMELYTEVQKKWNYETF